MYIYNCGSGIRLALFMRYASLHLLHPDFHSARFMDVPTRSAAGGMTGGKVIDSNLHVTVQLPQSLHKHNAPNSLGCLSTLHRYSPPHYSTGLRAFRLGTSIIKTQFPCSTVFLASLNNVETVPFIPTTPPTTTTTDAKMHADLASKDDFDKAINTDSGKYVFIMAYEGDVPEKADE